jgi:HSP20 family protein
MLSIYHPAHVFAPKRVNNVWSNLMEHFFDNDSRLDTSEYWVPRANTVENEKDYVVELLMPGTKKENIKLQLEKDVLTVSSESKEEQADKFHFREFGKNYKRSFTLPEDVNADQITASYSEGILTIMLPKVEKAPEISRQIEIQ